MARPRWAFVVMVALMLGAPSARATGPSVGDPEDGLQTRMAPPRAELDPGTGAARDVDSERALAARPRSEQTPVEAPLDPDKYICNSGDVFLLNIWGQQNVSSRITVDLSGRVFLPKLGPVTVAGRSLADASKEMRRVLSRYYPGLNFDISLATPRTFLVHVVENVARPGVYVAQATERLTRVIERAGGVLKPDPARGTSGGSQRRVEIRRRDGSRMVADLVQYYRSGDLTNNPFVLDGDVIAVPFEGVVANVGGAVYRPGRYELLAGMDLSELIALAGGLKGSATSQLPIRVARRSSRDDKIELIQVHFGHDKLPAFALRDEDRVTVPSVDDVQGSVLLVGAFEHGTRTDESTSVRRLPFEAGDTVRTLIERAGGVGPGADLKGSFIVREAGPEQKVIPVDLEALLTYRDIKADRAVEAGDVVTVPLQRHGILVQGAVMRPGTYQFNPKLSLMDYVANAGGATKMARSQSEFRLVSPSGSTVSASDRPRVRPGDAVVVPERTFSAGEVTQIVIATVGLVISSLALVISASR